MFKRNNRFQEIHGASWAIYGAGEEARVGQFDPGDFILTKGAKWQNRLIRFGQALRHRGRNRQYIRWTHAALITSYDGELIEAVGAGVRRGHLSAYKATEYRIVRLGPLATVNDRLQMVKYAKWCLKEEYGYSIIFSIGVSLLTGGKFRFGFDGQAICSGLVARALERTGVILDKSPSHIMPADLAKYFKVVDD